MILVRGIGEDFGWKVFEFGVFNSGTSYGQGATANPNFFSFICMKNTKITLE